MHEIEVKRYKTRFRIKHKVFKSVFYKTADLGYTRVCHDFPLSRRAVSVLL